MKPLSSIKLAMLSLVILIAGTLSLKAQKTKNVAVSNFNQVAVSAGIELHLTQGNAESAKIIAQDDVIDEVVVERSGNRVKVGWKENWGFNNKRRNKSAKVYITYKTLNNISASSGSSLKTDNMLKADRLEASVSSGASINAQITCDELILGTSSGASAAFAGTATNMKIESSSGSSINASGLMTQYAKVDSSSGSDITINVNKALETHTSSGSSIRYKGNAAVKNNSKERSSSVSRIN